MKDWTDGSAVQTTEFAYRGPTFRFQLCIGWLTITCNFQLPGDPDILFSPPRALHTDTSSNTET